MSKKGTKTEGIQPYVIDIMAMNLSEQESLDYLERKGYSISNRELYRIKAEIKNSTNERLNLIAAEEFTSQHISRLDNLRLIEKELWANYNLEKNPTKRSNILMQIAELQQILASFFDSTRQVLETGMRLRKKKQLEEIKE